MPDDKTDFERHFDAPPETIGHDKAIREAIDLARAYKRVFSGIDGETVLADLKRMFYARSSLTLPVDPSTVVAREGERNVMIHILFMMETAESAGPATSSIAE